MVVVCEEEADGRIDTNDPGEIQEVKNQGDEYGNLNNRNDWPQCAL